MVWEDTKANSSLPCVCRTYFHRLLCRKILGRNEIPFRSKLGGCRWIFPLICNQGGKQIRPAVLISPRKYGHPSWQYWLSRYLRAKINPAARARSRRSPSSAPTASNKLVQGALLGRFCTQSAAHLDFKGQRFKEFLAATTSLASLQTFCFQFSVLPSDRSIYCEWCSQLRKM